MKVDVEINIYDAVRILRAELSKRHPGMAVDGVTVKSWNTVVFAAKGETMEEPVRHHLRREHSVLDNFSVVPE